MSLDYRIIRNPRRRRLSITISAQSDIHILAPKSISERDIEAFVQQQVPWINRTLKKVEKHYIPPKTFKEGETFMFLGENYRLQLLEGSKKGVEFKDKRLKVSVKVGRNNKEEIQAALLTWYKERAKDIIPDRVEIHAKEMGLDYNQVRIKTLKTRWGSCSSLKNLNFNWVLMMTPIHVLDYVVIHELAHLVHMNHSKSFWDLVEQYCPDYREHKKWLNDHVALLHVI